MDAKVRERTTTSYPSERWLEREESENHAPTHGVSDAVFEGFKFA